MHPLLHLLVQNQVQRGVHFVVLIIGTKKHFWQLNGLWPQDNLSRGNLGAVEQLQKLFPEPGRLQFIFADLGDSKRVSFLSFFLSFHHLHKSYIVFIYFSFIPWGNVKHLKGMLKSEISSFLRPVPLMHLFMLFIWGENVTPFSIKETFQILLKFASRPTVNQVKTEHEWLGISMAIKLTCE